MKTRLIADCHIHLYPEYEIGPGLVAGMRRLIGARDPEAQPARALFVLAERRGQTIFDDLASGRRPVPGLSMEPTAWPHAVTLQGPDSMSCVLLAGRQVETTERIEVLAMGCRDPIEDGQPAKQVVQDILKDGAIPALAWAPGKWMFSRARVVRSLLDAFSPAHVVLMDSALRPRFFPEPELMKSARRHGFCVLAGSDPLPFAGEERRIGTYSIAADIDHPDSDPRTWLRNLPGLPVVVAGRRLCPAGVALRLWKNARARRKASPLAGVGLFV